MGALLDGWPDLAGEWVGELTPPEGGAYPLYSSCSRGPGSGSASLSGRARICDPAGGLTAFDEGRREELAWHVAVHRGLPDVRGETRRQLEAGGFAARLRSGASRSMVLRLNFTERTDVVGKIGHHGPDSICIESDDHTMFSARSNRSVTVPENVPASAQNRAFRANRSQLGRSRK